LPSDLTMKLQEKLNAIAAATAAKVPAETLATMHRETQALIDRGLAAKAPSMGDMAPGLTLPGPNGEVSLDELRANGPVVLTWFRGNW